MIRVPMTPAQAQRVAKLQDIAAHAAQVRDNVISTIIEGATERDLTGWSIQILATEIVVLPPENGVFTNPLSPAESMTT
jgi:hypothetical protein